MNVFFRELRANRKALLIWSICMFLLVISGMGKYTAYTSGNNSDVFNQMPHLVKALFGFANFNVTTIDGFYAFLFIYLSITLAIHAILLGCGIVSKEERDKTTEFLMAKPISRRSILTAKYAAAIVNLIIINLVTYISSLIAVNQFKTGKDMNMTILLFMVTMLIMQLIFFSLGTLLAALVKKPRTSSSAAAGILLVSYFIARVTDLKSELNILNILSPFKYFDYGRVLNGDGLSLFIVILSLLLTAIFTVFTYRFYEKREFSI